jgi:hypothetical protein
MRSAAIEEWVLIFLVGVSPLKEIDHVRSWSYGAIEAQGLWLSVEAVVLHLPA